MPALEHFLFDWVGFIFYYDLIFMILIYRISYQWLLSVYCQCGDIDKATEICAIMDKENVNIIEGSFNHLVECYIICGYVQLCILTLKIRDY